MNAGLRDTVHAIADHYGLDSQAWVTAEECSELIQALSKMNRYGESFETRQAVITELADVYIMVCEMLHLLHVSSNAFEGNVKLKVNRQIMRINEEERK